MCFYEGLILLGESTERGILDKSVQHCSLSFHDLFGVTCVNGPQFNCREHLVKSTETVKMSKSTNI